MFPHEEAANRFLLRREVPRGILLQFHGNYHRNKGFRDREVLRDAKGAEESVHGKSVPNWVDEVSSNFFSQVSTIDRPES